MTSTNAPVRRSALETSHRDAGPGWPMSYGNPDAERLTVATAVGLAEPGLYDKWILRGPGALGACRAAGLDGRPGFVTPAQLGGSNVWTIADDEVWLVAYAPTPGGPPTTAVDFGPVVASARRVGVHATDVSSGWSLIRLFGPRSRDLLEELVTENLSPAAVPDLAIVQIPLGGCRVILSRRDSEGVAGFTILVGREDAVHLWELFSEIGEAHGIRPVGVSALLGPTGGTAGGGTR